MEQEMIQSKTWYKSKTVWLNALAAAALIIQSQTGFVVNGEAQGAILVIINLILRAITKEQISWK